MSLEAATKVEARGDECQDRVEIISRTDTMVVVIADGAGGTSGGAEAAQTVIQRVREAVESERELNERGLRQVLLELAVELDGRGQSTAVVVAISRGQLVGASVGDSGAWLVERDTWRELTEGQPRKPLLGDGFAEPLTFRCALTDGELMLATDGVLKYASGDLLRSLLRNDSVPAADCCDSLIDAARLPNRRLQDDAAVAVIRLRPEAELVVALRAFAQGGPEVELSRLLERWFYDVPHSPLASQGFDGVASVLYEGNVDGMLVISGSVWTMSPQVLHSFRAHFRLARDRIEESEVQFADL